MIAPVRESTGLSSPPAAYTTNRNESMNNVAKLHADYRKSSWVQLTNNMFELVVAQSNEVEKAVMSTDSNQPIKVYIEVSSDRWFVNSDRHV